MRSNNKSSIGENLKRWLVDHSNVCKLEVQQECNCDPLIIMGNGYDEVEKYVPLNFLGDQLDCNYILDTIYADLKKKGRMQYGFPPVVLRHHNEFAIEKVIFSNPCTIIIWKDGTKTIVRCQEDENFDPEKGMAMAFAKKALGNKGRYYDTFKKWLPKNEEETIDIEKLKEKINRAAKIFSNYII